MRFARVVALDVAHHVTQRGNARRFIPERRRTRGLPRSAAAEGVQRHGVQIIGALRGHGISVSERKCFIIEADVVLSLAFGLNETFSLSECAPQPKRRRNRPC